MQTLDITLDTQTALSNMCLFALDLPASWRAKFDENADMIQSILDIPHSELDTTFIIPDDKHDFITDLRDIADAIISQTDWKARIIRMRKSGILNVIDGVGDTPPRPDLTESEQQKIMDRVDRDIKNAFAGIMMLQGMLSLMIDANVNGAIKP